MTRPYPYQSWPKATRRELAGAPDPGERVRADRWAAGRATARRLLGEVPSLQLGLPGPDPELSGIQVHVRLRPDVESLPWLLTVPAPMAAAVADRALGGTGEATAAAALVPREPALDPLSAGALAYALSRILASLGAGLTFDGFADAATLQQVCARGAVARPVSVGLGDATGVCFLWCPPAAAHRWHGAQLRPALRRVPLSLHAVVGHAVLPISALRALAVGDVVIPDTCNMAVDGSGEAELWPRGGSRAMVTGALAGDTIRIQTTHELQEQGMGDQDDDGNAAEQRDGRALSELSGDAPVALQLEIARFEVPLEQLLQLRPGELLSTGRAIGAEVSLVAAGHVVATGELVDVEGVVGLRVREVAGAKTGLAGQDAPY